MPSCYRNLLLAMPEITVYINCDTRLAVNLGLLELSEYDEFIFNIKNYDYIDSSSVFLLRATTADLDDNGEVIFNIDPDVSKKIKPGAFYNFAILKNANNPHELSEYIKLSDNGKIKLSYGAHDLALGDTPAVSSPFSDVLAARLESTADETINPKAYGTIVDMRLEDTSTDASES